MLDILLYRSSQSPPLSPAQFVAIAEQHGAVLRAVSDGYYCGQWQDPQTKASIDIDIGRPLWCCLEPWKIPRPMMIPTLNPKNTRAGKPAKSPSSTPHRTALYAVEVAMWLEGLLKDLDGCGILERRRRHRGRTSATGRAPLIGHASSPAGKAATASKPPAYVSRAWIAAAALPLALSQRTGSCRATRADLLWPQAMVLGEGERAVSTAVWPSADSKMALPDIDYVVIQRENAWGGSRMFPATKCVHCAPMPTSWAAAGASP